MQRKDPPQPNQGSILIIEGLEGYNSHNGFHKMTWTEFMGSFFCTRPWRSRVIESMIEGG